MNPYFSAFLALPPILIGFALMTRRKRFWPVVIAFCLVGWALVVFAIEWKFDTMKKEIDAIPNPPEELIEAWATDGAQRVFGTVFGWLYSLVYILPWIFPAWVIRQFLTKRYGEPDGGVNECSAGAPHS
jgi:uncharacterized membrane protein YhaH (DUF805 family)